MSRYFRSTAADDLTEYRQGYPNKREVVDANDNIRFYTNQIAGPNGLTIEAFHQQMKGEYRLLERQHNFIQWIFPIQEPGLNPDAQVLMKHEVAWMRQDPGVMRNIWKSFCLMVDFYGMKVDVHPDVLAAGTVPSTLQSTKMSKTPWRRATNCKENPEQVMFQFRRKDDSESMQRTLYRNLNTSPHNYLRITRILKCLGELGMEDLKLAWLMFFATEVFTTRKLTNCASSLLGYWSGTIYDDEDRVAFLAWMNRLQEDDNAGGSSCCSSGSARVRNVTVRRASPSPPKASNGKPKRRSRDGDADDDDAAEDVFALD